MEKFKFTTIHYAGAFNFQKLQNTYDYVEEYDPNKKYCYTQFLANYTGIELPYQFHLYDGYDKKYVVAHRIFTDDQLIPLQQYCNCPFCSRSWYNLTRYCYCQCCYGCIKAGADYADEARVKVALAKLK